MLNLDPSKLLIIAVVAVILLGPDRLPQVARQVGAAWRSFGEFRNRMESEVRNSIPDLPSSADIARLARSPSALLNHLSNMAPDEDGVATADGVAAGTATSADPPGDEQPVPGSSDAPDDTSGSTYTPTDPMPPTSSTRPLITPEDPGPVDRPPPAPPAGDPGLN